MKSFTQFIGEREWSDDRLPVLRALEESGEYSTGEIMSWFKENLVVDSEEEIVEHTKGTMLYDVMLKKHARFTKGFVPWSRISFGKDNLDYFKKRKYAVIRDNATNEPLCFWIAKRDERLFYKENAVIDQLFQDF